MNVSNDALTRRVLHGIPALAALTLALGTGFAAAQPASSENPAEPAPADVKPPEPRGPEVRQTFFLKNITQQNDFNDIQTDLRNMEPRARIFGVMTQNAISVSGTEEEIQAAQRIISELDRPKRLYRLTYTFTDLDNGKRGESQQYSLVAIQGESFDLKQGTKVPIVTGSFSREGSNAETQTQFMDVGLKIEATVTGVGLHSKIERSSVSEEKSGVGPQDPILRQTVLTGTTLLPLGKPVVLGTLDIPGAPHRQEVAVSAEALP
jgi:type II secretory pathway component GspD/PulD (secretin)